MLRAAQRRGPCQPGARFRAGPGGASRTRPAGALGSDGWGRFPGTRPRRGARTRSLPPESTRTGLPSGNLPGARGPFPPVVPAARGLVVFPARDPCSPRPGGLYSPWSLSRARVGRGLQACATGAPRFCGGCPCAAAGTWWSRRRRKSFARLFGYYCPSAGEERRLLQIRVSFSRFWRVKLKDFGTLQEGN